MVRDHVLESFPSSSPPGAPPRGGFGFQGFVVCGHILESFPEFFTTRRATLWGV